VSGRTPPRLGLRARLWYALLRSATHPDDRPFVLADVDEEYGAREAEQGESSARRWLRDQAWGAIRPGLAERWRRRGRGTSRATGARAGVFGALAALRFDARYAVRSLRRSPALAALVVASLGIGIGATTVVFSVARSLLFPGPGPLTAPERVVTIYESAPTGEPWRPVSFPNFLEFEEAVPSLQGAAAVRLGIVRLGESTEGERLMVELVTGNYFEVLGIPATFGRTFDPSEMRIGSAEAQVVVSHDFWQNRLGGRGDVLGTTLEFDGRPHTVIGVAPPDVTSRLLQVRVAAWIPLGIPGGTYNATEGELSDRWDREYLVLGRLADGASLPEVEGQLAGLAASIGERFPDQWADDRGQARHFTVLPEAESRLTPELRTVGSVIFTLLLVATGLILAIACSNVAGLLLARAQRRGAEMSIRVSIGAGRARIVRLLMTESGILAALGCLVGWGLTVLVVRRGATVPLPGSLPDLTFRVPVDVTVLAFSATVAVGCAVLFGLAPALQAARNGVGLARGVRGGGGASRGRRILVSAQVAGSVVFLVAAGLLSRSVGATIDMDAGLDTERLAVVNWRQADDVDPIGWRMGLEEELLRQPEIDEVALGTSVEISPFWDMTSARMSVPGRDEPVRVPYNAVTPNYADLLGLDLRRGRWLDGGDRPGSALAIVVNERFVSAFLPGGDPIGRTLRIDALFALSTPMESVPVTAQIVGVAETVQNTPLEAPGPYFWVSYDQLPALLVMVHARGEVPARTAAGLARLTAGEVTLVGPSTYAELADTNTMGQKVVARLLGGGALFALVLAVVGLGGLLSVSVAMRLPELSIRRALGASSGDVVRAVLSESGRLAAWGLALGWAIVLPVAALSRSFLPGVSPVDPATLIGSVVILGVCALGTALPPAMRAVRADPLRHLRGD
jgi:predicted permease